jgi:hypothetical protein
MERRQNIKLFFKFKRAWYIPNPVLLSESSSGIYMQVKAIEELGL